MVPGEPLRDEKGRKMTEPSENHPIHIGPQIEPILDLWPSEPCDDNCVLLQSQGGNIFTPSGEN